MEGRCRKVIALDGCFLKRPNLGKLLSAIGRDVNNQIYLVAWAVVNVENKDNWSWFFELLEEDLGCSRGNGLTLMSDQHKGLIEVVKDVMPNAEHRQCARHINENFRKHYSWFWHVIPASGNLFEVRSESEGFTVDEGKKTCSCKMWQLSEIPYVHAIKVIFLINKPDQSMYSTVFPLKPKKMPGRPIKKRIISKGRSKKGGASGSKQGSAIVGGLKGGVVAVKTQDDPVQTQDDPVQTQADPMQTQNEDQVEQTQEEAEIDLTQVGQTQKHTQD
ncbi:multidrug resistance-associated protein 5 [Tanacetum coccineum]